MFRAQLELQDFKLAMERSFILYLRNRIPYIDYDGTRTFVDIYPPVPYEQFESTRRTKSVITVSSGREGKARWKLGTEMQHEKRDDENYTHSITYPFWFKRQMNINCYSSSPQVRSKLDGALDDALQRLVYDGAPVYEFISETEATTAYDTGSRITIQAIQDITMLHSEDIEYHDYMTHCIADISFPYIFETITSLVTSVSAIYNLQQ